MVRDQMGKIEAVSYQVGQVREVILDVRETTADTVVRV